MKINPKKPHLPDANPYRQEKSPPDAYPIIYNDLARDNAENDIPAADLEDFPSQHH